MAGGEPTGLAHPSQNFADGRSSAPQLPQILVSELAHSSQNLALSRFSWPQLGQVTRSFYRRHRCGAESHLFQRRPVDLAEEFLEAWVGADAVEAGISSKATPATVKRMSRPAMA